MYFKNVKALTQGYVLTAVLEPEATSGSNKNTNLFSQIQVNLPLSDMLLNPIIMVDSPIQVDRHHLYQHYATPPASAKLDWGHNPCLVQLSLALCSLGLFGV